MNAHTFTRHFATHYAVLQNEASYCTESFEKCKVQRKCAFFQFHLLIYRRSAKKETLFYKNKLISNALQTYNKPQLDSFNISNLFINYLHFFKTRVAIFGKLLCFLQHKNIPKRISLYHKKALSLHTLNQKGYLIANGTLPEYIHLT